MQNRGESIGSALFGEPERIGVERGISEFRAGRPVLLADKTEKLLALPVDGIDAAQLAAFIALSAPAAPDLIITARRARTLGLAVDEPVALELTGGTDLNSLSALTAEVGTDAGIGATPATAAARGALDLAKIALRLPAVLAVKARPGIGVGFEPPLVTVAVDAMKFHKPIHKGDEVTIYTRLGRVGRTSVAVDIECWVRRRSPGAPVTQVKVTEGRYTFVAVGENGAPVEIAKT